MGLFRRNRPTVVADNTGGHDLSARPPSKPAGGFSRTSPPPTPTALTFRSGPDAPRRRKPALAVEAMEAVAKPEPPALLAEPVAVPGLRAEPATAQSSPTEMVNRGLAGQDGTEPYTYIQRTLTVRGNLVTDDDMMLDGIVIGDVTCRNLVIGEHAMIEGDIDVAENIRIYGTVNGSIRAKKILMMKSARVRAGMRCEQIGMDPGCEYEGDLRTIGSEPIERGAAQQSTLVSSVYPGREAEKNSVAA